MISYVLPQRIVEAENVKDEKLLLKKKDLQIGLSERELTTIKSGGVLVLDFGKEICGGVRILTYSTSKTPTVTVRITFGESLSEAYSNIGEKNATDDHSPRALKCKISALSDLEFGQTGFRFVRIECLGDKDLLIKSIVAKSSELKAKSAYEYRGDDEQIKRIFTVAKRTVDLCASGRYLWDGIKRDRLVWIGDIHPEMLALTTLYGRCPIVERSLDFVKKQTPLPSFMNNFPTYSMWWIIILADYLRFTENMQFAKKQLDYLIRLIDLMDEFVSEDGSMHYPGYFVDWQSHNGADEITGSRFINIIAVKKAIEILKICNLCCEKAEKLLQKLQKGNTKVQSSKGVLALKYFAFGKLDDKDYEKLIEGGSRGLSTFMSYYILTAVASRDKELAVKIMKEYYGAMLNKGATTFWEDFDMDWVDGSCRIDELPALGQKDIHGDYGAYCYEGFRHSLCHGWSAGVIRFIFENC